MDGGGGLHMPSQNLNGDEMTHGTFIERVYAAFSVSRLDEGA